VKRLSVRHPLLPPPSGDDARFTEARLQGTNKVMHVAIPPAKPLLVFDGDCTFCRKWIARWQQSTGDRVEYVTSQEISFPEIPAETFTQSVVLIEPDGNVFTGARAVFRSLNKERWYRPIAAPAEFAYRLVARYRAFFSLLTRLLWGTSVERPSYIRTRSVFLRALGGIYFIAFVSLWLQITGLIGSQGIMPAQQLMTVLREQSLPHHGWAAYWLAPTLCWLNASDTMLHLLCGGGAVLAVLVMTGYGTLPALVGLWVSYLSLSIVGDVFLGYQWDALLLETGFLGIFFALGKGEPSRAILWLLRLLLFKLMFFSGAVKLVSGDALWQSLTALTVHYQTQPLPHVIAWYAHHLPVWFQKFSCGVMFLIELALPFLIFVPRRPRLIAAGGFVFLQLLIILTGNYTFFNWLAIVLCIPLLDDRYLRSSLPAHGARPRVRGRAWITVPLAVVITFLTIIQTLHLCRIRLQLRPVTWAYLTIYQSIYPLRSVNSYGLFAVMTANRPEIILEGSNDGTEWKPYEFKYKPGDLKQAPRLAAPHQPRLDWQMWFESLRGTGNPSPWFLNFCVRLLQGEPAVLRLLAENPFPDAPPRYLRAVVYEYRFTTAAECAVTGAWWKRAERGPYCPILSLR